VKSCCGVVRAAALVISPHVIGATPLAALNAPDHNEFRKKRNPTLRQHNDRKLPIAVQHLYRHCRGEPLPSRELSTRLMHQHFGITQVKAAQPAK
jgi:hypothetical protein